MLHHSKQGGHKKMAAGDTVRIGPNPIYKGGDRYAPGSEVPASRFTKSELEAFTANGSLTLQAKAKAAPRRSTAASARPKKAEAPKESGGTADSKADDAAKEDGENT
jgi:hypothetical protein